VLRRLVVGLAWYAKGYQSASPLIKHTASRLESRSVLEHGPKDRRLIDMVIMVVIMAVNG
jgi:hypothetical protein